MTDERIHLCPICQVVEMRFKERIVSNKPMRKRRFECPICDFQEMYLCGGPDDVKYRTQDLERTKNDKDRIDYKRLFGNEE